MISVAIDGPSGAGKSTIAKAVAKDLGYLYIDTGALYRSIGLYALRAGAVPTDREAVEKLLPEISLNLRHVDGTQRVFLNGEDVSEAIRTPDAAKAVADRRDDIAAACRLILAGKLGEAQNKFNH